jgi:phosphoribosyl 1,2-cyclic phosphate phosphodiesterase
MRVLFLGTGTSHGVPVIGCRCDVCLSDDPRDKRWRTSILVTQDDDLQVLVDTSIDLRAQALHYGITRVDSIVFTHSHADHVFGLDECRRFNVLSGGALPLYADEPTMRDLRRIFAYAFEAPPELAGGVPSLAPQTIDGPFMVGATRWTPIPIFHGRRLILGFRIGQFAYLTDCSAIPDQSWPLLEGVDMLVLDALRDRPHPTHFSVGEAIEVAQRVGASSTLLVHMAHEIGHAATCARLPDRIELAYDGLVIDVPPGPLQSA